MEHKPEVPVLVPQLGDAARCHTEPVGDDAAFMTFHERRDDAPVTVAERPDPSGKVDPERGQIRYRHPAVGQGLLSPTIGSVDRSGRQAVNFDPIPPVAVW